MSARGAAPPVIVMLVITLERNARSTNRRHVGLSASPNKESLRRRITPGDGNETEMSRGLIDYESRATAGQVGSSLAVVSVLQVGVTSWIISNMMGIL
jgi:hypothetical protein